MKIVADENLDKQIVDRLRAQGHDVLYIAEFDPGIDDDAVLSRTVASDALLVTSDKDFGELVYRQGSLHSGVVLVRLAGLTPDQKADVVGFAFERYGSEFGRKFSVISERAIRIRAQRPIERV